MNFFETSETKNKCKDYAELYNIEWKLIGYGRTSVCFVLDNEHWIEYYYHKSHASGQYQKSLEK